MDSLAATAPFLVLKFGGTSVATAARWKTIADLTRSRIDQGFRTVVVVSAVSGVTNRLLALMERVLDRAFVAEELAALQQLHRGLAADLGIEFPGACAQMLALLAELLEVNVAPLPYDRQAEVLALGELMSSTLGAAFFRHQGLAAEWLDSRTLLTAEDRPNQSEWARWLSVSCATPPNLVGAAALAEQAECFVAPGFIASNAAGATCILGRGGSDTSAAYLGAVLGAARVEIWTDVAGMFSADPRQVPAARLLEQIDYAEAQEIATTGGKVLHPRCLGPVRDAGVPMWIKDTQQPALAGTVISTEQSSDVCSIKAISSRRGIMLVSMETVGMWQQVGFLADVFDQFKRHGLSVDLIGSAETNVTISLDPTDNLVNSNVLEALCADLAKVCRVKVIGPCAAVSLVGRGMRSMLGRLGPVWQALGDVPIHLVSQSSNDLNLTFVIDESRADGVVARVHAALIESGALRTDESRIFGASWQMLYRSETRPAHAPWWREARHRSALLRLAERTPRYVYHRDSVRQRAAQLRAISAVDRWFYAIKANDHPELLAEIAAQGFDLECVSPGELARAQAACPDRERLFSPNLASKREWQSAIGVATRFGVDDRSAFETLAAAGIQEIALRVDLGDGRGHHDKVRTGGSRSKFGVGLQELRDTVRHADALGLRIGVLHAHLGSGVLDAGHFLRVHQELARLAESIPSVHSLNIGGGIGVASKPDECPLDLARLADWLDRSRAAFPQYAIWMEPGRFLVAEAGVLLTRVNAVKPKSGRTFVGVDAGMHNLLRPALYEAWHPIHNLSRLDEAATQRVDVVGPICESGDVLGRDRELPPTEADDVLLVEHCGAYGAVMASDYNRRAAADEVLL